MRVREREVEIERPDAVTAANYCCSMFQTVCLIFCPVENDGDALFLTSLNTHEQKIKGHKEEKVHLCSNY